jgi:hypothetical protein
MFNKIYLSVIFTLLLVPLSNLFSQAAPQEYKCLELSNGVPTGYTIVLTVAHLPNNVVQVTRTRVTSNIDDIDAVYNLTSQQWTVSGNRATVYCTASSWYVPFGGGFGDPIGIGGGTGLWVECECSASGGCGVSINFNSGASHCILNELDPCQGTCIKTEGRVNGSNLDGSGLIIEASNVICIDNY